MKYKFFLSYSSPDRSQANELYSELRKLGAEVFLDHKCLRVGDSWPDELIRALRASRNVVFLISKNSADALFHQGEVLLAIKLAKEDREKHRLCPILLEEPLAEDSPLMLALGSRQALRLADAGSLARAAELLMDGQSEDSTPNTAAMVVRLEELLLEKKRRVDGIDAEEREREIADLAKSIRARFNAQPGDILAGGVLGRIVGSGNFGTIWLAHKPDTDTPLAIKVFDLNKLTQGVMLWRFRRSIEGIRTLNRRCDAPPNIVRIHEVSDDDLAFSMDYLSKGNLEDVGRRRWSDNRKIEVFLEICRATEFAHRSGVIHRDIKPANVVMDASHRPVLTDFDISDIKFVTRLSVASGGLGTPVFAAPEQLEEGDKATEQSDVYSLGRLLHFLLIERPPPILIQKDPDLVELSGFSPTLVEVVRNATQIHPSDRFANVAELIRATERYKTRRAQREARKARAQRWVSRNKWQLSFFIAVIVVLAGVACVLAGVAWYQARVAEREEGLRREIEQASLQMAEWQVRFGEMQKQKDSLRDEISRLETDLQVLDLELAGGILTEQERELKLRQKGEIEQDLAEKRAQQKELDGELEEARRQIERELQRLEDLRRRPAESRAVTLRGGRTGEPYRVVIPSDIEDPVRWTLENELPPGLNFADGILEGRPTEAGEWKPQFTAIGAGGTRQTVTASLSISESPLVRSSSSHTGAVGAPLEIPLPRLPDPKSDWSIEGEPGLPPGLKLIRDNIVGVPQMAGRYVIDLRVLDSSTGVPTIHTLELTIDNDGCQRPELARCGTYCVSLVGNPFHDSECFRIAPDLRRENAKRSREIPPWPETENRPRQLFRLYYTWDEYQHNVQVAALGDDLGWSHGVTAADEIVVEIPAESLVGRNHIFVVGELTLACKGQVRVADFRSTERVAYEKLSTRETWSRVPPKDWSPVLPSTTESSLHAAFRPLLDDWRAICADAGT